ncbi:hypothetical protein Ade02nite_70870 [Paractinoplanes deccanensis]|uniref:Uncharacterized protein n=1 Tax=Paractinoplanes deccanensis TaxID=113561 RepID=A0ABQ3YEM7_9ACTN|nr:hypothetical protein [Actinoplanes deccanensis]GID78446.1 hypothetical protein Ade02nite_70870 [Actinoplanes deccanensis]
MSDRPTVRFPAFPEPPEKKRHTWRVALVAALATLALLVPLVIALLLRRGDEAETPAVPAPPSSGTPSPSRPRAVPDGHIALATLQNATLTIPPWPKDNVRGPSGRLRFRDGVVPIEQETTPAPHGPPRGMEIVILDVAYGDLDRDGADETVARIGCLIEGGSQQVVAFDRNAAGRIVTMGTVVATTGAIRDIGAGSVRVSDDGVVTARVADYQVCCDDRTPQVWQRRGYRWAGGHFDQVSGPVRMALNPYVTDVAVTAGELVLGPAVDGFRYGTVAVTVRHVRGTRPAQALIEFFPSEGLERAGTAWPAVITGPRIPWMRVSLAPPPARGSHTYTFAFRRPAGISGGSLEIEAGGAGKASAALSDSMVWNNGATVAIRTAN